MGSELHVASYQQYNTSQPYHDASHGVIMVHVKGHSGDIGNDYGDTFVQDGKGSGPLSRIWLNRGENRLRNAHGTGHSRRWLYRLSSLLVRDALLVMARSAAVMWCPW